MASSRGRRCPQVLREIEALSERYGLRVANVFHAGDGNLHPLVLYDERDAGRLRAAEELAGEILRTCVASGGSITGEHGVGMDKRGYMPVMFSETDMATHQLLALRARPGAPGQPRQGLSDAAPLRRDTRASTIRTRWRRRASPSAFSREEHSQ